MKVEADINQTYVATAEEHLEPPEAGSGTEGSSPGASGGSTALLTP